MPNWMSVFNDTEKLCKTDKTLISAIKNTIQKQYIITSDSDIRPFEETHRFDTPVKVIVSPKRTFEAAQAYQNQRVCVLNFASATHIGGGVKTGAKAQEECLCRCSTLYFAIGEEKIAEKFHARHRRLIRAGKMNATYNDDCIFSPDIVVIKSDTVSPERLPENERYKVDVITCAAPNLNPFFRKSLIEKSNLRKLHKTRAKRILDIAKSEKEDVLILGAFGCGAFKNPPKLVSEVWAEVLKNYLYDFRMVEFAVYCQPDRPSSNFGAFRNTMENEFKTI